MKKIRSRLKSVVVKDGMLLNEGVQGNIVGIFIPKNHELLEKKFAT